MLPNPSDKTFTIIIIMLILIWMHIMAMGNIN